ncbi:MAG TPA: transposase, partial [Phototrophicaceae bacterium]|nr:transposase [Phototrophicaceae bacterium]
MAYRTLAFNWLPETRAEWQTFTSARLDAARLWNDMVERHARIRRLRWRYPSKSRWETWAKRRYPHLHSQTVQQIIGEFCEAVNVTVQLRKKGQPEARYPWRKKRYRDTIYTNQAAKLRGDRLILPNGSAGDLKIRLPDKFELPGSLMEVRLTYGRVLLVCKIPDQELQPASIIGVDLGVNTLIAATDGEKVLLVNGRSVKSTVQWRNKRLKEITIAQNSHTRYSRRWKRLQRRKRKMLDKARNRVQDATHKATAIVRDTFPDAKVYVGEPFNDAARKVHRHTAQQVSDACNRRIIRQLDYKTLGATEVPEHYSSQTCPVCGGRQKCRRIYQCKACGCTAPRDVIGAINILSIGLHGEMQRNLSPPTSITYRRLHCLRSSGGHPASSSR